MKHLVLLLLLLLCASYAGMAQPANDDCANATSIGEIVDQPFSNVDATTDGPFHPISPCPGSGEMDSLYNDIWYLYTASFDGYAEWSLCGTADFDTKIGVYTTGNCPPLDGDLITCNEDADGCDNATSLVIFPVVNGQSYLLRLAGFGEMSPGEEGTGTFTISEFIPSLPNDFCDGAIAISLGENQDISTVGASTDGPLHPDNSACFGFGDNTIQNDIWFSFTPDESGAVEWSTCNTVSFDSRMAVYGPNVSCPVVDGDLYACNDDGSGCSDYTSRVNFEVTAGQTYLLRIGGYVGETGTGTFDLVNVTPPTRPENDLCVEAEAITVQAPDDPDGYTGTTVDATFNMNDFSYPVCLANQSGGEFAEVWYAFNSEGNPMLDLTFGSQTTGAEFFIDIWESCVSGPLDSMTVESACFISDIDDVTIDVEIGPLPPTPTDYVMRVVTRLTGSLPGDFFFQLKGQLTGVLDPLGYLRDVTLFPNPVSNSLQVTWELNHPSNVTFELYDTRGVIASATERSFGSGMAYQEIPVTGLPGGIYMLRMIMPDAERTFRFVKQE